jgi:hypothetical protein
MPPGAAQCRRGFSTSTQGAILDGSRFFIYQRQFGITLGASLYNFYLCNNVYLAAVANITVAPSTCCGLVVTPVARSRLTDRVMFLNTMQ